MKIQRLKLRNFKHFEDQTIEFNKGINVLIGENNAGKTSIIQAIAALFNIPFGGSIENDFPSKFIEPPFTTRLEIDILFTDQELDILRGLRNINIQLNRRLNDEEWDKIKHIIIENNLFFKLRLDIEVPDRNNVQLHRGGLNREDFEIFLRVNEMREKLFELDENQEPNVLLNKIEVNLNQIFFKSINNPPSLPFKPLILFPFTSEFQSSERFISYNELQRHLKDDHRNRNIRSQLFHLERKNPAAFKEFKNRMEDNFQGIKNVNIKYNYDTGFLNLNLDSFGRDITLYGGGTQTFAQIFSIIGFENYTIVLIDEPDAHLHASLAENFIDYLNELSFSKQIIFTTHLPNIINIIPAENIISLNLEAGKSNHIKSVEEIDLIFELSKMGILPSTFDIEVLKRAEIIILTEGKTDKPIFNSFLKKYQNIVDDMVLIPKIEFLPIGKIYSSDLNKIKTGIIKFLKDKKIIYIRDRDEDSPEEIKRIIEFDEFPVHIWTFRQIESYLLNISAIVKLLMNKKVGLETEETIIHIKKIFSEEMKIQFSKLLHDYISNRAREGKTTPERDIDINLSSDIDEITDKIHTTLIAREAVTHIGNIDKNKIKLWIQGYLKNWKQQGISMINAKDVLSKIRKKFDLNFQNKDLVSYFEEFPEEIKILIEEHLIQDKS